MNTIKDIIKRQKTFVQNGETSSLYYRSNALRKIKKVIINNIDTIINTIQKDCSRPELEVYVSEIVPVLSEIDQSIHNLKKWNRKTSYPVANLVRPANCYSKPQAHGCVLIIGPWNYPFNLLISPLISSIAAGNATILKPSEFSPHTAEFIKQLFSDNFPSDFITTLTGGADVVKEIIQTGVDFVFFTGGIKAGSSIMMQAAQHITPVALELGGKCPCIIDNSVNVATTARLIVQAKFFNAGQTCIAPDYCLVPSAIMERFIQSLKNTIRTMYGPDPMKSPSYSRIINERHFQRVCALLKLGKIVEGGTADRKALYISPTIMVDARNDSSVLQEEIFGPVLPVVRYSSFDDAVAFIKDRPSPLTAYLFSTDTSLQNMLIKRISIGNIVINATLHFMLAKGAPFGGTGRSGFGRYHGKSGFDTFSTTKTVFRRPLLFETPFFNPPYRIPYRFIHWFRKLLF